MSSGGLSLYREVLRSVRSLPLETRSYYRVVAREKFAAHREEEDPARVAEIIKRSKSDVLWIVQKYADADIAAGR
jgi:chorismate mutase